MLDGFQQHRMECLDKVLVSGGPAKAVRSLLTAVLLACKTGEGPLKISQIRNAKDQCYANTQVLDAFVSTLAPSSGTTLQQGGQSKRLLRLVADLNCSGTDLRSHPHSVFSLKKVYQPDPPAVRDPAPGSAERRHLREQEEARCQKPLLARIKGKVKLPGKVIRWDKGFGVDGSCEPKAGKTKKGRSKKSALTSTSGAPSAVKRGREGGKQAAEPRAKKVSPTENDELGMKRGRENTAPPKAKRGSKKTAATKKSSIKSKKKRSKKRAVLPLASGQKTLSSMWR